MSHALIELLHKGAPCHVEDEELRVTQTEEAEEEESVREKDDTKCLIKFEKGRGRAAEDEFLIEYVYQFRQERVKGNK